MKKRYKNPKIIVIFFILINLIIISNTVYSTTTKVQLANGQTHLNGIYKLAIGKDSSKVIEVKDKDKSNNALIDIKQYENTESQKFYLDYQSKGYYKIIAMHTGKSLTVKDNKIQAGSEIVQYEYKDLDSQKWTLRDSHKNGWIISPLSNPNLALTIDGTIKNGSKIILNKTQDNDNQMLYVFNITKENQKFPNGIYKLAIGKDSSKVLEVKEKENTNDVIIDLNTYKGEEQQKFYLDYQEEGYYKIIVIHNKKSLTVKDNKIQTGSDIVQYDYKELESQKWILRDSNKNGWIISPLCNPNLAITIDGSIKNGSKLILSKTQDNDNQMLYIFNTAKENQKFSNGIYKLAIGKDSSKVLEVKEANKSNNTTINIKQYENIESQKFYLDFQNSGYYKITAMHTGKSLTIKDNKIQQGSEIVQYDYQELESQKWILRDSNKNGWIVSPMCNPNLALTIDGSIKNGSKLILNKTKDNDNQMLYVFNISKECQKFSDGVYKLAVGKISSKVLEVTNGNKFNEATIDINDYHGDLQQKFYFDYLEDGYYKIMPIHTWKCLTVKDNKIQEGKEIVQSEYKGLESQKWILRDSKINGWVISPLSNPELAISINGAIKNNSKIILSKTLNNDNQMLYIFGEIDLDIREGQYGKSGLMHKGTGGQYLKYYKIGKGNKHLFLNFSIHGFEDSYYRDGQELTYIADEFYKKIKKEMLNDLAEKWTIFILPSLNPDGEYNGWTNNGPGRTTLYSWAANNKGIDMNRCFPVGYKSSKNSRNYNGEQPLQAYEAEALRNCILYFKGNENIVIDVHGWLNETMGDNEIGKYYRNEFNIQKHIGVYGNGYFINWARTVPNTRSMLLELPEVESHNELISKDYANKFYKATINMLRYL